MCISTADYPYLDFVSNDEQRLITAPQTQIGQTYASVAERHTKNPPEGRGSDSGIDDTRGHDETIATANRIRGRIAQYTIDPSNKCPKPSAAFIMAQTDELVTLLHKMASENIYLKGLNEKKKERAMYHETRATLLRQ